MIFKQLWNQRRQNGWILLELIVIAFFLFTTSAEVVRGTIDYMLPDGYEKETTYLATPSSKATLTCCCSPSRIVPKWRL